MSHLCEPRAPGSLGYHTSNWATSRGWDLVSADIVIVHTVGVQCDISMQIWVISTSTTSCILHLVQSLLINARKILINLKDINPFYISTRRLTQYTPRYFIAMLSKMKGKDKILRVIRKRKWANIREQSDSTYSGCLRRTLTGQQSGMRIPQYWKKNRNTEPSKAFYEWMRDKLTNKNLRKCKITRQTYLSCEKC